MEWMWVLTSRSKLLMMIVIWQVICGGIETMVVCLKQVGTANWYREVDYSGEYLR